MLTLTIVSRGGLPEHPASERLVKYFIQRLHALPVTPCLQWHCPKLSLTHAVLLIAPIALQLHSANERKISACFRFPSQR